MELMRSRSVEDTYVVLLDCTVFGIDISRTRVTVRSVPRPYAEIEVVLL